MTNESVEFEILINTFLFLALARENISIKMYIIESRFVIHGTGEYTVCWSVCTVFSPDILQARGSEGVKTFLQHIHVSCYLPRP